MVTDARILFIGNSYTGRNDLPGLIRDVAANAPQPIRVTSRSLLLNGMPLRAHLNRGEASAAIQLESWTHVVLQEQSTLPLKNPARMRESIRLFDPIIRKAGARTTLYMTWTREDAPDKQDELSRAYTSIGEEIGALVVPVGFAWQRVRAAHPEIRLHEGDKSHPTLAGSYLAACTFCGALFGQDPVGAWVPPKLATETAKLLQQAAREVTSNR